MTLMPEQIVLRLYGGPAHGQQRIIEMSDWPPPERVAFPDTRGGHYHRTRYSQLPAGLPHILRGGEYSWVEGGDADA